MPSPCADLIEAFCDHHRDRGHSRATVDHRRTVLRKADRELPSGLCATKEEIKAWLYRADLTANAKYSYYGALTTFYAHWSGRPGGLACNPMTELPRPPYKRGRPRPVTHEQLRRILTAAADPYRLWSLIAAGLGARCIEISRLDREHITAEETELHGKGDKLRTVPTHPQVWAAVRDLPAGPVARTTYGNRAGAKYVSQMSSAHFREIGLPGVTMHRLRHRFATDVYQATGDLLVTKELLGHERPETTAIYAQVAAAAKVAAVAAVALPVTHPTGKRAESAGAA